MHTLEVPSDYGPVRIHYDGAFDGEAIVCYPVDQEWRVDATDLRSGRLRNIPSTIPVEVVTRVVSAFTKAYLCDLLAGRLEDAIEDALDDEP
jgi:uncharacterized protein (DUF779 family)